MWDVGPSYAATSAKADWMMDDKTQVGALGVGIDGSDKWTVGERRVCFVLREGP